MRICILAIHFQRGITVEEKQYGKKEQRVYNNEFVSHLKFVICSIIYKMKRQDKLTKKAAVNTIIDSGLCIPNPMI